jgi:hypothetical protein
MQPITIMRNALGKEYGVVVVVVVVVIIIINKTKL